jgi:hypothetical protein
MVTKENQRILLVYKLMNDIRAYSVTRLLILTIR